MLKIEEFDLDKRDGSLGLERCRYKGRTVGSGSASIADILVNLGLAHAPEVPHLRWWSLYIPAGRGSQTLMGGHQAAILMLEDVARGYEMSRLLRGAMTTSLRRGQGVMPDRLVAWLGDRSAGSS